MRITDSEKLKSKLKEIAIDEGRITLSDAFKAIDEVSSELKEMRLPISEGELVVSIDEGLATQAAIGFDSKETGYIDLALVECKSPELAKEEGGRPEDVRVLAWGDVFNEDHTYLATIKKEDIEQLKEVGAEINRDDEPER